MAKFLYDTGLRTYNLGIGLASLFNDKAKDWTQGRKEWAADLSKEAAKIDRDKKTIWFHVSSLGEFEQGRPVMEKLKEEGNNLVLTFYSPSGYNEMRSWKKADVVSYLPLDTKKNAKKFITIVQPDLAVFVKYDLWFHYLNELKRKNIPSILISARFYPGQLYFKQWTKWGKNMLFLLDKILVQDKQSKDLLDSIHYPYCELIGDTRYDRVEELSKNTDAFPEIEKFIGGKGVFIAGSSWPLDEKVFIPYILENDHDLCYIIAPHDVGKNHIDALLKKFKGRAILNSQIADHKDEKILIIDGIGMLSRLYKYAKISYVGGAFKEGLHNILEPAAYGLPVITGPNHKGFLEGSEMEKAGALIRVKNENDFSQIMEKLILDSKFYFQTKENALEFVNSRIGASEKSLLSINAFLK